MSPTTTVIGVDEVGYGCSAGPLFVCAFAAPDASWTLEGLGDSKKISKKTRERLYSVLTQEYLTRFVLVSASVEEINRDGLGKCHHAAMARAAEMLIECLGKPERLIFDGGYSYTEGGEGIPKADSLFASVSAASVLAKVARDAYVVSTLHTKYPAYGFDVHKGYWTDKHKEAVVRYGVTPEHRTGYRNIQELLPQNPAARFTR